MSFLPLDMMSARHMGAKESSDRYHLFCYLSAAFRMGKLFISESDDPRDFIDELPDGFDEAICRAFELLESESPFYVKTKDKLYLRTAFEMHESSIQHYERLQKAKSSVQIDLEKAKAYVAIQPLLKEQREAILHALQTQVASITGGPGTGKTYTAGLFLKTFLHCMPPGYDVRIALTAPTGKATSNLAKSIERAIGKPFEAKTLHALLKLRPFGREQKYECLPYDLVIVDESSMIDTKLFKSLVQSLRTGTRLLFLGDTNQLPPIEPGAPFMQIAKEVKQLSVCMRTEHQSIVKLAGLVCQQKADEAISFLKHAHASSGIVLRLIEDEDVPQKLVHMLGQEALYDRVRLLTPLKSGPLGTQSVNALLYSAFKKSFKKSHPVPIMVTKNDYQLSLTNGQMGTLVDTMALFESRKIPRILLGPHEYAFCISVHKSQGSEFDDVVLLLPRGSERFGSSMLYTAITRAKSRLTIWATESVLRQTILGRS